MVTKALAHGVSKHDFCIVGIEPMGSHQESLLRQHRVLQAESQNLLRRV